DHAQVAGRAARARRDRDLAAVSRPRARGLRRGPRARPRRGARVHLGRADRGGAARGPRPAAAASLRAGLAAVQHRDHPGAPQRPADDPRRLQRDLAPAPARLDAPMKTFALHTDRLRLRKLGEHDLDALVELDSDPEVMRFINDGVANSRALYRNSLLPQMLAWSADDPVGFYAAIHAREWIGWFHLRPSIADQAALELGYRLRRAAWGRGLATEGARALASFAVDE